LGTVRKEILIGVLVALSTTFFAVIVYVEYFFKFNFEDTLQMVKERNLYGKVLSLAAIPNLIVFFVFLKKKQDARAKGVLMATFLIAFTTLILKFF
jgi:hypothetical protein